MSEILEWDEKPQANKAITVTFFYFFALISQWQGLSYWLIICLVFYAVSSMFIKGGEEGVDPLEKFSLI